MKSRQTEWLLIVVGLLFAVSAWARWRSAPMTSKHAVLPVVGSVRRSTVVSLDVLERAGEKAVANDPFRLSNTAPSIRYDPVTDGATSATPVTVVVSRPLLVLKGIVGGPPWQAIIDGLPGQPAGTVARQGIAYDNLVIRAVTRDSVVIRGPDTTWVLTFRKRS